MNSKKILSVLGFMAFFFLMQYSSYAQHASYSSGGNIIVTLPSLRSDQVPPNQQYYTLFIETGDGNYKKVGRIENSGNIPPQSINYPYRINTKYNGVINVIGHYDTFPPPLRQILIHPDSNPFGPNESKQGYLQHGVNIAIDYSDTTLVPGDTTTMVVTYKPDPIKLGQDTSDYILAFFYNDLDANTAGKIFAEITNPTVQYGFESNALNTRAIRLSNSEIGYAIIPGPNIIPNVVSARLAGSKGIYNNGLYFLVTHGASADEKNIFISLSPDKLNDFNYAGTSTTFKAVRIKYSNGSSTITTDTAIITLPVRLLARDPNGLSISPSCIDTFHSKKLRSTITFQNDGPGVAYNVKVTMNIPTGMEFPPANFAAALHTSNQLVFFKNHPNPQPTKAPDNFYSFDVVHRQINFTMNNIMLKGTRPLPPINEIQRRAEIIFDLKPFIGPLDKCVNVDVSIVFENWVTGQLWKNRPVKASAPIKKNCKPGMGPCPRLSPGGQ